jgi:hypothetical protein
MGSRLATARFLYQPIRLCIYCSDLGLYELLKKACELFTFLIVQGLPLWRNVVSMLVLENPGSTRTIATVCKALPIRFYPL